MKALYVVTAYNRDEDDVITPWLVETIRRMGDAGVGVEVLAPSYRGLESGEVGGVRVHRFRYAPRRFEDLTHDQTAPDRIRERPSSLALVPSYAIAGAYAAARLARRGDFDLVHVHWPIPHAVMGLAARTASSTPLVCSFHGVELTWTRRQMPFLMPFLRYVIRASDAVTVNSTHTAGLIQRVHDRKVERIPFGAAVAAPSDAERPAISAEDAAASVSNATREIGRGRERNGPFEVLFVGRLVERKGIPYLLEAMARLRERRESDGGDFSLTIIGDGADRASLEARAARLGLGDRVRFAGFVPSSELSRAFASADAFVLPAVRDSKGDVEGLGVVLIEAMSYGLPVIASESGGIVDIVRDHETGLLVPPCDADAIADAIETLERQPELCRRLTAAGHRHIQREFSWSVIIDRLVRLYRGLVRA